MIDMDLKYMNSKLSVLIPTHRRPQYLLRAVEYWDEIDVSLYIADSSPNDINSSDVRENFHHLPHLNLPQKIYHVLKQIETPFVAMCADDDFI